MERIKYVDALKLIAILSIILMHSTNIWSGIHIYRLGISFYRFEELFRFGVPLFLMITGMLTLNREIDLADFFKRKTVRIFYPLIFFFIISYALGVYHNFFSSFWYCWMVIGIYLAIPVISIFIRNAKENDMNYLIALILISSLIYTVSKYLGFGITLDLDFFLGPASYLLLGYWLAHKDFKLSPNRIIIVSLIVFILITIFKLYNKDFVYVNDNGNFISFLNLSLPQIIQTASVFLLVKYLYESSDALFGKIRSVLEKDYVNSVIVSSSRSSYGIYLVQMILFRGYFKPLLRGIETTATHTFLNIAITAIVLFITSWLIVLVLSRIPFIKKFSGYA